MNVIVSARHCAPPETIRGLATARMERLLRYEPRLAEAEVALDMEHGRPSVEARLSVRGAGVVVANAEGETFEAALGRTADRLGRQLRRRRGRRRDHRAASLGEVAADPTGSPESP